MISKKLLTCVLGMDILEIENSTNDNILKFVTARDYSGLSRIIGEDPTNCNINIYELAHKCKEWALLYGYELNSCLVTKINNPKDYYATTLAVHSIKETRFDANALSEPEAIFKACQWILDTSNLGMDS